MLLPAPTAHRRGSHANPGHVWRVSHPALPTVAREAIPAFVSLVFSAYGPILSGAKAGRVANEGASIGHGTRRC